MEEIYFAKLRDDAVIPEKKAENAGMDIYPCFDEPYIIIKPLETKLIPTGIISSVPENYYIQIQERGSTGSLGLKYSAGVIDSGYRGEWFLAAVNLGCKPFVILKQSLEQLEEPAKSIIKEGFTVYPYKKALFQAIIHCVHNEIKCSAADKTSVLSNYSQRGDGKLGSSGK